MAMPSKELLPNYMKTERWTDLFDVVDEVFGDDHGLQSKLLKYVRHQFIPNDTTDEKSANGELIDFLEWDMPDRTTAALQTELDGLRLNDSTYIGNHGFVNLHRNIGTFWYSKGLYDFIDFIAYTLNTPLEMVNLWTNDYKKFIAESEFNKKPELVSIVSGGDWYPTTHVTLRFEAGTLSQTYMELLLRLFYDISNYTLVLHTLEEYFNNWIAPQGATHLHDNSVPAQIVYHGQVRYSYYELRSFD